MAEKYLGQLTAKSAPATGDILVLEDSEDTKKIDYDALANAILNKLTTKTYTVAGGTNTLIAAIDALNSNLQAKLTVPNNISGTTKFTIADGYRGILFITDSASSRCGQYIVYATGGGAVGYKEVSAASGITFGSNTHELILNIDSGARTILFITISNTAPTIKS